MEYIQVAKENLEKEHICCAISDNKENKKGMKKCDFHNISSCLFYLLERMAGIEPVT